MIYYWFDVLDLNYGVIIIFYIINNTYIHFQSQHLALARKT